MTAGDNIQNSDRIDSHERANDFATKCSLEAWERTDSQVGFDNRKSGFANSNEEGFLDFGANDPLLLAQANSNDAAPTKKGGAQTNEESFDDLDETTKREPIPEHHYYQSLFIHLGESQRGLKARWDDPGHVGVQYEDTTTGYKSQISGLSPKGLVFIHPIRAHGYLENDSDYPFDMQVRREISKEQFDQMSDLVKQETEKGDIGYGVLFPKQCTTEAIKLSSFGGWAIETPKEKVAPFLPAQVTPNSLYETFSKPQSIDLTNLDERGRPRPIEVIMLSPETKIDPNRDVFED